MTAADARALCRVAPSANVSMTQLYLGDNPSAASTVDLASCQISAASRATPGRIYQMLANAMRYVHTGGRTLLSSAVPAMIGTAENSDEAHTDTFASPPPSPIEITRGPPLLIFFLALGSAWVIYYLLNRICAAATPKSELADSLISGDLPIPDSKSPCLTGYRHTGMFGATTSQDRQQTTTLLSTGYRQFGLYADAVSSSSVLPPQTVDAKITLTAPASLSTPGKRV